MPTVKEIFDAEGIEIPYPRRDVTIVEKTIVPAEKTP